MDLKNFDIARIYGKECVNEGTRNNNLKWVINVCILLAKLSLMQRNKFDANNHITFAQEKAKELDDHVLQEYLKRCEEVLDKVEFDDFLGPKMLEKRQKKIVEMMATTQLKQEFTNLFRAMSAVPTKRRMTIMPGVKSKDYSDKNKLTQMSILGSKATKFSKMDVTFM